MVIIDPLSKEPTPKFIDFGLSAILLQNEKCGDVVGSIAFMSPELVVSQPYDKRTDIWSIGIILYILLTGRYPFINSVPKMTL
jgi:serine/threonine-protein kinase